MLKKIIIVSAALLAGSSAQAVTFTSTAYGAIPAGTHVIDSFEHGVGGIAYSGSYTIANTNVSGFRAAPSGDATNYFSTPATTSPTPGSATIDLTGFLSTRKPLTTFGFYWGSIDRYNTLTLIGTGLTGPTSFTGADINNPANGDQSAPATNRFVTFTLSPGETLTGINLTSTSRAFEVDNLVANVPEPAAWAMMLVGFGLVGTAVRTRGRAVTA